LLFDLPDLSINILGEVVVHCSDFDDLQNVLKKYSSSTIIIAYGSDKISKLDRLLINHQIDTSYLLNNEKDKDIREWLDGLVGNNIIVVQNEKQLMRRLCTTAMSCYYKQCKEYQENGNNGMANLCILDSLKALDYSAHFI
jgi:hypothetical protein